MPDYDSMSWENLVWNLQDLAESISFGLQMSEGKVDDRIRKYLFEVAAILDNLNK